MSDTSLAADLSPKPVAAAAAPDASKMMIIFIGIVATLYFGKDVLVPVTLALLLAFVLAPLVGLLRRAHLGRVPSALLAVLLALGVIVAIGGVIGTQVAELSSNLPQYASTIEAKVSAVNQFTVGRLAHLADSIGSKRGKSPLNPNADLPKTGPAAGAAKPAPAAPQPGLSPLQMAERYVSPVLSPLATLGIVIVVAIFALLQREDLRDRLIRLVGSSDLHRTTLAIDDGARRLSKYFLTQLAINTFFGIVIGLGLLLIGVPSPVLWGILAMLLRFVPYVGSFIAAALPLALAAAVEPGWSMVAWTATLFVLVEGMTGQIIEPTVYGHSTGLSPFSVVVAAIFWSWLWGPIGLILSTPLTLCLVVLGRHIQKLEFLDIILGDRPALTPVESFYQRILAGDADEAQDQAELLLKDRSLATYYDDVALKGLQMAAGDAISGAMGDQQLNRIMRTVEQLVNGLDAHGDRTPVPKVAEPEAAPTDPTTTTAAEAAPLAPLQPASPNPWQNEGALLCIAGRGPLDEAASSMLAQLLDKHGMGSRLVSFTDVSRDRIGSFDVTGAAMVCISYLDIAGSPAHLRYLIRRLRQRLPPKTPILVGLWPAEDATLKDKQMQLAIGADYYISTLREAVAACETAQASQTDTLRQAA